MSLKKLFLFFIGWRLILFIFLFFAISTVTPQLNFLGGGLSDYLHKPYLWSWLNFDGEHFLSIAYQGYQPLTYFYFPAYPLLVRGISVFSKSVSGLAIVGLLVSHAAFLIGMIGLVRLIKLDYKEKIDLNTVLLLLLFPTSFYFASFYSESLFFALVVWSFYLARSKKWILAGILGGISTATRFVGIALLPALLLEAFIQIRGHKEKHLIKSILYSLLVLSGIFIYALFLRNKTGDYFEFYNSVGIFGQQRSAQIVLFPQVFYRYLFKIIPSIPYGFFPTVYTTYLELLTALLFLILSVISYFKQRLSYAVFLSLGFLIPTLSGSFSSLPRYVLVLFPGFILMAVFIGRFSKFVRFIIYSVLIVTLWIATSLFVRGFWIS